MYPALKHVLVVKSTPLLTELQSAIARCPTAMLRATLLVGEIHGAMHIYISQGFVPMISVSSLSLLNC